jgi:sodium transport system permease protein
MPRWAVVRLIAGKELRDLVRDRRTLLLVLGLPAVLYPLFGGVSVLFITTLIGQPTRVGVVGAEHLPDGKPGGYPPLLAGDRFSDGKDEPEPAADGPVPTGPVRVETLTGDPAEALRTRRVDAVLVVPPNFTADLEEERKPTVTIRGREGDEKGKIAARRLAALVRAWEGRVREVRFAKRGLPTDFDKVLTIEDPQGDKPKDKKAADELRDAFARVFPFILMMWLVAGAIQPAVDMTAGEKERGTMETLLISPAERSEIVFGKFLATTAFSFGSVVWNVLWLTAAALLTELFFGHPIVNLAGMAGCVVLGLPLAMLFSAVCVALGVFAKSTKEGQYYLLPLVLVTMPLAFWSMAPGAELKPGNCWVPVAGAMLLQQRLLSVAGDPVPWEYFAPVLGSLAAWVGLALTFAVWQFRREAVLFRESAPAGVGLRQLLRWGAGRGTVHDRDRG